MRHVCILFFIIGKKRGHSFSLTSSRCNPSRICFYLFYVCMMVNLYSSVLRFCAAALEGVPKKMPREAPLTMTHQE